MSALYGFGLAQEDECTEALALDLPGGRVVAVASGGDMPLSLLALGADSVAAIDIDPHQVHLGELKKAAVLALEREEAIAFLGFLPAPFQRRRGWLAQVLLQLPPASFAFWERHRDSVVRGVIQQGRYERYITRLRTLLGPFARRTFRSLVACRTIEEQRRLFARRFERPWLRAVLRLAFRARTYGESGIDAQALRHLAPEAGSLGDRFFARFRDACTRSPARDNYLLQVHLLGTVRDATAVPAYLSAEGFPVVRRQASALSFHVDSLIHHLCSRPDAEYDRFHLSNLPDWLSATEFDQLLEVIVRTARPPARVVWRYLHRHPFIPPALGSRLRVDRERSTALTAADRFPVYAVETAEVAA